MFARRALTCHACQRWRCHRPCQRYEVVSSGLWRKVEHADVILYTQNFAKSHISSMLSSPSHLIEHPARISSYNVVIIHSGIPGFLPLAVSLSTLAATFLSIPNISTPHPKMDFRFRASRGMFRGANASLFLQHWCFSIVRNTCLFYFMPYK